jgi:hypothetical protein
MTEVPAFGDCRARLFETEDVDTDRLRADGRIVMRIHGVATAEVQTQTGQDIVLGTSWPTGSGIVARSRLQGVHLPRATTDLMALADIGMGMLVAAEAIDAARSAKFRCVAGIPPDSLLGLPITSWLTLLTTTVPPELKEAIDCTVELFTSAVTMCDEAVEAILGGLCAAMAAVDISDYAGGDCGTAHISPAGNTATVCPERCGDAPADSSPATPVRSDAREDCGGSGTSGGGGSRERSSVSLVTSATQHTGSVDVVPTGAVGARSVTVLAGGSGSIASTVDGTDLTAILGSVAVAVGSAVAGSIAGVVEMLVTAGTSVNVAPVGPEEPGLTDEELTLKAPEIAAPPSPPTSSVGQSDTELCGAEAANETGAPSPAMEETSSEVSPEPVAPGEPPPSEESSTSRGPDVQCPTTVPPVLYLPRDEEGSGGREQTQVTPQASEQQDPAPPDDGLLALAGEQ